MIAKIMKIISFHLRDRRIKQLFYLFGVVGHRIEEYFTELEAFVDGL
jgi:hypothetical protein